jgi:hypothetical protein
MRTNMTSKNGSKSNAKIPSAEKLPDIANKTEVPSCGSISEMWAEESIEIHSEDWVYERILNAWEEYSKSGEDSTIWEAQCYIKLMKLLKTQPGLPNNTINNALLLILSLFSKKNQGIGLTGRELQSLSSREKEATSKTLRDLYDPFNDGNF